MRGDKRVDSNSRGQRAASRKRLDSLHSFRINYPAMPRNTSIIHDSDSGFMKKGESVKQMKFGAEREPSTRLIAGRESSLNEPGRRG
jgi:hypothetical protein